MCKRSNVLSRPVLIGRGLGLNIQFRENAARQSSCIAMECLRDQSRTLDMIIHFLDRRCLDILDSNQQFLVVMAAGSHPFPFRTRKLSLPAPMVLGGNSPGRVGRCQIFFIDCPHCLQWGQFLVLGSLISFEGDL